MNRIQTKTKTKRKQDGDRKKEMKKANKGIRERRNKTKERNELIQRKPAWKEGETI